MGLVVLAQAKFGVRGHPVVKVPRQDRMVIARVLCPDPTNPLASDRFSVHPTIWAPKPLIVKRARQISEELTTECSSR